MATERNYAFRQRLDQVHRPDRRNPRNEPGAGEAVIGEGWRIAVPEDASSYLIGVAQDLQDYLFTKLRRGDPRVLEVFERWITVRPRNHYLHAGGGVG